MNKNYCNILDIICIKKTEGCDLQCSKLADLPFSDAYLNRVSNSHLLLSIGRCRNELMRGKLKKILKERL